MDAVERARGVDVEPRDAGPGVTSLRTNVQWSMPGTTTSSTYDPCPVSRRASSRRWTDWPTKRPAVGVLGDGRAHCFAAAARRTALMIPW